MCRIQLPYLHRRKPPCLRNLVCKRPGKMGFTVILKQPDIKNIMIRGGINGITYFCKQKASVCSVQIHADLLFHLPQRSLQAWLPLKHGSPYAFPEERMRWPVCGTLGDQILPFPVFKPHVYDQVIPISGQFLSSYMRFAGRLPIPRIQIPQLHVKLLPFSLCLIEGLCEKSETLYFPAVPVCCA